MIINIILLIFILLTIYLISNYDNLKIKLMNYLIILRGITTTNCFWWNLSDKLLDDGSGINLYNNYKKKYGDFVPTIMFGKKIYIVTNIDYIKIILKNSPNIFGVGLLKKKFFKSFMEKNVGVSEGCQWKHRRNINEKTLSTGTIPKYYEEYDDYTKLLISEIKNKKEININDMNDIGKKMCSLIVFGKYKIDDFVFDMFSTANINFFNNTNSKKMDKIRSFMKNEIENPKNKSLIKIYKSYDNDIEEIIHQIPHFMFPIIGLYTTTIPRLLCLLFNSPQNIMKIQDDPSHLRKCVLETLRLNNPVITTFRTLLKDYNFDNKYFFKKNDQFLILNNPILREKYFDDPNKFYPERWNKNSEKSFYSISFNQGPQMCPGKEFAIYLCETFILNFIELFKNNKIQTIKIDMNNVPQMINPCDILFNVK